MEEEEVEKEEKDDKLLSIVLHVHTSKHMVARLNICDKFKKELDRPKVRGNEIFPHSLLFMFIEMKIGSPTYYIALHFLLHRYYNNTVLYLMKEC